MPNENTSSVEEPDDLRATLEAAWSADLKEPEPSDTIQPAEDMAPEPEAEASEEPAHEEAAEPEKVIEPPVSWSAAAKEKFRTLDPDIQQEVLKREKDVSKGFEERANEVKKYAWVDEVLAPIKQQLDLNGLTERQAVQRLLAAQQMLDKNPMEGLKYLAKSYGVNLDGISNQQQTQQNVPAELHPILQEMQTLKGQLSTMQQYTQHQVVSEAQREVELFKADPKNKYFDQVRGAMSQLMATQAAANIQEAYEQAIWTNPTIRTQILDEQKAEQKKTDLAMAKAREAKAAKAGQSIPSSSPSAGSVKATEEDVPLREMIARQFNAASARI